MNITLSFDICFLARRSPNCVGELLRNHFFDQQKPQFQDSNEYGETGCYSTFEINNNIIKLKDIQVEFDAESIWQCYLDKLNSVEMRYYWDGDGTLLFILPDLSVVVNSDCKNDYEWEYYENYNSWLKDHGTYNENWQFHN